MPDDNFGPSLEIQWNFPLVRAVSTGRLREMLRSRDIPDRISKSTPDIRKQSSGGGEEEQSDSESRNEDLRDRINELRSGTSEDVALDFEQEDNQEVDVTFNGNVFTPVRAQKEEGGTLRWTNNSDEDITIISTDSPTDFEVEIESGSVGAIELDVEGVHEYRVSDESVQEICGAIVVGDADVPDNLPCEEDIERQVFTSSRNTLSEAAEQKEREF